MLSLHDSTQRFSFSNNGVQTMRNSTQLLTEIKIPVITCITVAIYSIAYAYQLSLAYIFGYPSDLIVIDIGTLLKTFSYCLFLTTPVILAILFSIKIYKLNRFWIAVLLVPILVCVLYVIIVGANNPLTFYNSNGKPIIFSMIFLAFYPIVFTWQILMNGDGKKRFTSLGWLAIYFIYALFFTVFIASLSAYATLGKFKIKEMDKYYVINNSGGNIIVGKCLNGVFEHKVLGSGNEVTYLKNDSSKERDEYRKCWLEFRKKLSESSLL